VSDMKACPYCGETIQATAKKCRYCGEWIEGIEEKWARGSPEARAVSKGLKEKSFQDAMVKVGTVIGIAIGMGAAWAASKLGIRGNALWYIALATILVAWLVIGAWYWSE
jgi:hypothetical protein